MRIRPSLVLAWATSFLLEGLTGRLAAEPWRIRGALELERALLGAVEDAAGAVDVLVVARETREAHPAATVLARDPMAARRAVADCCTRSIRSLLACPESAAPGAPGTLGLRGAAGFRYLWIANAVATRVDRRTLDELRRDASVAGIYEDRYVLCLGQSPVPAPAGAVAPGADATPGVAPVPARPPGASAAAVPAGRASAWGVERIGATVARQRMGLSGKGILIGHIDSGVDGAHPRLTGKIARFRDFVGGRPAAYDDKGHGTHSAGTLVGAGVGVAPGARLVVAKALDAKGGGKLSALVEAMQWMLDPDGNPRTNDRPRIVSNSWGASLEKAGPGVALFRDAVKAWRAAGIVPVAASGNFGPGFKGAPAGFPEALTVGASGADDGVAWFSSSAVYAWEGVACRKPDVVAPGVGILSCLPGGKMGSDDGTSMATPHVAGALALLIEARPDLPVERIEAALTGATLDVAPPGPDERAGSGRIDVLRALATLGR